MELGNMMFGNSRGEYQVSRALEPEILRLFEAAGLDEGYGGTFDNPIFSVRSYYWGDCTCGWDDLDNFNTSLHDLEHLDDCYRIAYRKLSEDRPVGMGHDWLKELYHSHGWSTDGHLWWTGCAVKCTCDYGDRYNAILKKYTEEFGHEGHKENCLLIVPNFRHYPSGVEIDWYKYPLRDSYSNVKLTLESLHDLIDSCIASLPED